jgi:DNA-binding transcriptional regulator YbjK
MPRPRDPEGRRQAIARAAADVITEVGIGRTTHRAIAARADVPLGATTYYFPTLADLVAAGLGELSSDLRDMLTEWAVELGDGSSFARDLARLVTEYATDRRQALLGYELFLAAARADELAPLAHVWLDGAQQLFCTFVDEQTAVTMTALIDGTLLHAVATGEAVDRARLERQFGQLIGQSERPGSG